jgi:hypothetical protein
VKTEELKKAPVARSRRKNQSNLITQHVGEGVEKAQEQDHYSASPSQFLLQNVLLGFASLLSQIPNLLEVSESCLWCRGRLSEAGNQLCQKGAMSRAADMHKKETLGWKQARKG